MSRPIARHRVDDYTYIFAFVRTAIHQMRPVWQVPEFSLAVHIPQDSEGLFTGSDLLNALVEIRKRVRQKLDSTPENKSHPTPLKKFLHSPNPADEEVSVGKAAKLLVISEGAVRALCDNGILETRKTEGGKRLIRLGSVAVYRAAMANALKKDKPVPTPLPRVTNVKTKEEEDKKKAALLRVSEVAKMLKCSVVTVRAKTKKGDLVGVRVTSKEVRYHCSEVLRYISQHNPSEL